MDQQHERLQSEVEHFDRLAGERGEIWWGSSTPAGIVRLKRRARLLAEHLQRYCEPRVVELGCGTGAFSQFILAECPRIRFEGIDASSKAIEVAAKRLGGYRNATFKVANALALGYPDATIDAVVGNSVLHHLPIEQSVAEAFRVLKPGGLFWFSEPNLMNPEIALERNVKFVGRWLDNTPDETAFFRWRLGRLLRTTGFSSVSVRPFDFLHPAVPKPLIGAASTLGAWLERLPVVREFSGSLLIVACK